MCILLIGYVPFRQPSRPLQPPKSLQIASEAKYNLRFEISDPNYVLIHVHIAYMAWTLFAAFKATTASKQPQISNMTSNLRVLLGKLHHRGKRGRKEI